MMLEFGQKFEGYMHIQEKMSEQSDIDRFRKDVVDSGKRIEKYLDDNVTRLIVELKAAALRNIHLTKRYVEESVTGKDLDIVLDMRKDTHRNMIKILKDKKMMHGDDCPICQEFIKKWE